MKTINSNNDSKKKSVKNSPNIKSTSSQTKNKISSNGQTKVMPKPQPNKAKSTNNKAQNGNGAKKVVPNVKKQPVKKKRVNWRFITTYAFILLTAFMIGFCINMFQALGNGLPTPFSTKDPNQNNNQNNQQVNKQSTVLQKTERADKSYLETIVFIGDSITHGAQQYEFISKEQTFAESGINHVDAQTKAFVDMGYPYKVTLYDAVKKTKPDKIIFLMGINGVAWMNKSEFLEEYEKTVKMIQKASPNTTIILESILPVSDFYTKNEPRITNKKIDEYNKEIIKIAERNKMYYLDTASVFKDKNGNLNPNYQNGDGMHISKKGYEFMFDYIMTHTVK